MLTRRAMLTGAVSALATGVAAEAPLRALRPLARPGDVIVGSGGPGRPEDRIVARATLDDLIAQADLGGITGVVVQDLRTGRILEERNARVDLMPASVTKAVTALYALDRLGAEHRFVTRIRATGPVVDGVLQGDLVLEGGSDPVLDTDALAGLIEAALADEGIRSVDGGLKVWAGGMAELRDIDPGQLAHLGYNPGVSGINLNFNRVHFEWTRTGGSYRVTMDARSETRRPEVRIARMRLVERSAPVYAYEDADGIDSWSVARGALNEFGSRWLPVRRPALHAGDVMRSIAAELGVELPAPEVVDDLPDSREIARHLSPTLEVIAQGMLRFSTNLTAEVLGRAATASTGADASSLRTSAAAMNGWLAARYGVRGSFVDHSGLGDGSRISAAAMTRILALAEAGPLRRVLKPIPLVDEARERLPQPPGDVVAKTGTLNFVSTLAGYIDAFEGGRLAFTIFSADEIARDVGKASGDEQPRGSITYNTQAKRMQQRLMQRWARLFGQPTLVEAAAE